MGKFSLIILLVFTGSFSYAQNQKIADSLLTVYKSGFYQAHELELMGKISFNETDAEKSLQYAEAIIAKAAIDSSFKYLHKGYLHKGNALESMGENVLALESLFQCQKYANRTGNDSLIGSSLLSIAGTYAIIKNYSNAKHYYEESIFLLRKVHDSIRMANALNNLGDLYITEGKLDSALLYIKEATAIYNIKNHTIGRTYSRGNTGMIYAKQRSDVMAEIYLKEPIIVLEKLGHY